MNIATLITFIVYLVGMLAIGLATGAYLNWQFIAKRLRIYNEVANDSITVPDFLENRFNDKSRLLRVISALVILLFFTFYTSSGMVAGAKLFEASFGLSYQTALWLGVLAVVTYTFFRWIFSCRLDRFYSRDSNAFSAYSCTYRCT